MSFAGKWKETKTEGGEAFFKAFGAPEDKPKRAEPAELISELTESGDTIKLTRTYTLGGESKTVSHEIKVGTTSEIEGPLGKHSFAISRDGGKVTAKAAAIGLEMTFENVGGELVETWTSKGNTFKRFHAK